MEFRIDVFRNNAGLQGVRVIHIPSGIIEQGCPNKSQIRSTEILIARIEKRLEEMQYG